MPLDPQARALLDQTPSSLGVATPGSAREQMEAGTRCSVRCPWLRGWKTAWSRAGFRSGSLLPRGLVRFRFWCIFTAAAG